ncbi:MAG: competence/damage-inducible protein A, partial [Deltaproteobacteria bacterium]|nr:competence/damage-inducible protein A [Deltaproteobacteria bacterium]
MPRSAAGLIFGNEILSGKIVDTNTTFLARTLFELGIDLRRVVVCPDEVETIAKDLSG